MIRSSRLLAALLPVLLAACAKGAAPEGPVPMADVPAPAALAESAPTWAISVASGGDAAASATVGGERQRRANPLGADGAVSVSAARDGTERTLACGKDFTEARARSRASLRAGTDSTGAAWQSAEVALSARRGAWREKGTLTCGRRRTSTAESSARVGFRFVLGAEAPADEHDVVLVRVTGQPATRLALALADSAGTAVPLEGEGDILTARVPPGAWALTGALQAGVTAGEDGREAELSRRATLQVQSLRSALGASATGAGGLRRAIEVPFPAADMDAALGASVLGGADAWRPCPDKETCAGRGEDLLVTSVRTTALGGGARVAVSLTGKGTRVDTLVWVAPFEAGGDALRLGALTPAGSTLDRRTTEAVGPVVAARLREASVPVDGAVRAAVDGAGPLAWAGACVPGTDVTFDGVRAAADPAMFRLAYSTGLGAPTACPAAGSSH